MCTGNNVLGYGVPLLDASGGCYLAGWFQTKAVFGTDTLTGRGDWDFFLTKLGFKPLTLAIARSNA